jgi:hypothetical protein
VILAEAPPRKGGGTRSEIPLFISRQTGHKPAVRRIGGRPPGSPTLLDDIPAAARAAEATLTEE